jgi:DNA sulphur modification protein DndE
MSVPTIADIGRLDFRTSRAGDTATAQIQRALDFQYRYQPARLAIGRSLGIKTPPPPLDNFDGKVIRGETLFGQSTDDLALWTSLLVEHTGSPITERRTLQELVGEHWARGAGLLWDSLREAPDPAAALARQLTRVRA